MCRLSLEYLRPVLLFSAFFYEYGAPSVSSEVRVMSEMLAGSGVTFMKIQCGLSIFSLLNGSLNRVLSSVYRSFLYCHL